MNTRGNYINLIYEAAVVKRLQRTGWQILGDNQESIGEHMYMTAVIAYILAQYTDVSVEKVLLMSIFHDFHESRTGDFDKINKVYTKRNEQQANRDIFSSCDAKLFSLMEEYEEKTSLEAKIVYEANIIALLVEVKRLHENGNSNAKEWLIANSKRITLPVAKKVTKQLLLSNTQAWWKQLRTEIHKQFARE